MEAYAYREQQQLPAAGRSEQVLRKRACFAVVAPAKVTEVKKAVKGKVETKKAEVKGAAKATAALTKPVPNLGEVLKKASATAFRGGLAGFCAGVVQVRVRARRRPPPLAPGSCHLRAPHSGSRWHPSSLPAPLRAPRAGGLLHVDAHRDELPGV